MVLPTGTVRVALVLASFRSDYLAGLTLNLDRLVSHLVICVVAATWGGQEVER